MDHLSQMTDVDVETASGLFSYFSAAVMMAADVVVSSKIILLCNNKRRRPLMGRLRLSSFFILFLYPVFSGSVTWIRTFIFCSIFLFSHAFLINFVTFIVSQNQSLHICSFSFLFSYYFILTFIFRHIVNKKRLWKMKRFRFMTTAYKTKRSIS